MLAQLELHLAKEHCIRAQEYCDKMKEAYPDDHFMTVHQIKPSIAMGDLEAAQIMWAELDAKHPDDWSIQHWIGDLMPPGLGICLRKET